jgi:phosphoglycolate phosphatase
VLRAVYVDLDGTLLGPGGSLLAGEDGGFSLDAARALQACSRADVEVVIYTGRKQPGVDEIARLMGQRSYIFELGCGLVLDGELEWLTGEVVPSATGGTIYDQIAAAGAPQALLAAFPGQLEYHTPWSEGREISHLFRGLVPAEEASAVLAAGGWDWLRLVDNGVIAAHGGARDLMRSEPTSGWGVRVERVHAYHLIPAPASKSAAVARHMQNRGFDRSECIACGDSREDMDAADVVETFWLMANGISRDPSLAAEAAARPNVRITEAPMGAGVYEAVVATLAEQR